MSQIDDGAYGASSFPMELSEQLQQRYFRSRRTGLLIHHRIWPVANPKAYVYVLHGVAEYIGRYECTARALNAAGYAVVGLDHVAHGGSEGTPRGYFAKFDDLISDALQLIHSAQPAPAAVPRILMGHSMGAMLAFHTLHASMLLESEAAGGTGNGPVHQQYGFTAPWAAGASSQPGWGGFSGVLLSGIPLIVDPKVDNALNRFLARALSNIAPTMAVQALDIEQLAADPSVREQYVRDPLIAHGPMRVRCGFELMGAFAGARGFAPCVTAPVLFIHGNEDGICNVQSSVELHAAVSSANGWKRLITYGGLRHETLNEREAPLVLSHAITWMNTLFRMQHGSGKAAGKEGAAEDVLTGSRRLSAEEVQREASQVVLPATPAASAS